jgi:hypothetical protein
VTDDLMFCLAVFRATRLLQRDDVPPLPAWRAAIMNRHGASVWSNLLDCPWCLSVWVAAGLALLRLVAPRLARPLIVVLASSAVSGLLSDGWDLVTEHG